MFLICTQAVSNMFLICLQYVPQIWTRGLFGRFDSWCTVIDAVSIRVNNGVCIDFSRDPPAYVADQIAQCVRRWRWRRVEGRFPHLVQGGGGHGAFMGPIFKLLKEKGYDGTVSLELFSQYWWDKDPKETLRVGYERVAEIVN